MRTKSGYFFEASNPVGFKTTERIILPLDDLVQITSGFCKSKPASTTSFALEMAFNEPFAETQTSGGVAIFWNW